jgi:hypothetical protein
MGWSDFRLTKHEDISKWWSIIMSAYLLVCLHQKNFNPLVAPPPEIFTQHPQWSATIGWKTPLNNLRLILQAFLCFNIIKPWLQIFLIPQFKQRFQQLVNIMNEARLFI